MNSRTGKIHEYTKDTFLHCKKIKALEFDVYISLYKILNQTYH